MVRKEEDRHRSFGVPTIRKDIPFKDFKSVADYQVSISNELQSSNLIYFYRIMVMSPKQLTYCSHRTTQNKVFPNTTSEN